MHLPSPSIESAGSSFSFARIGLHAGSETRLLMLALLRQLKERHGSELHVYCSNEQEVATYRALDREGLLASITPVPHLTAGLSGTPSDTSAIIERAQTTERRFQITYNQLAVANRHLGRGYALGGFYHPRSRYSEESNYFDFLHAYSELLEFWDREIRDKRLTLVLNGAKELAVVARARGIPYRYHSGSRYRNFHYWGWNEYQESPEIEFAYEHGGVGVSKDIEAPYHVHRVNRTKFLSDITLPSLIRDLALRIAMHAWWHVKGYQKAKGYYLTEQLAYFLRRRRDWIRLRRLASTRLADLRGKRFVYYPLHTEPEAALQVLSPECFCQIGVIASISRDLPAGVYLAVKETFGGVGRRPDNFYDQIREFKNVVLLDPAERGLDCVKQADCVATICGTGGFEAAVSGVSVIAFGRHNTYNFLPHVYAITDEMRLKDDLATALASNFDRAAALSAGRRFLEATCRVSYDLRQFNYIDQHDFDASSVREAGDALEASLVFQCVAAENAAVPA